MDKDIPSNFEGLRFSEYQLSNHVECTHRGIIISDIIVNHEERKITVEIEGKISEEKKSDIQLTLDNLKEIYTFNIIDGGKRKNIESPSDTSDAVFEIASATSQKGLNAPYIDRDEELWFTYVEDIYKNEYKKDDLYFYDSSKSSCLVDFSVFQNSNLRNHLLLYDIVYCVLPLKERMCSFLGDQKISRDDILGLVDKGRLKIINTQPEIRLDYGFINEAFQTDSTSVVSRRAIATLCAIDLVEMNSAYLLNDPELQKIVIPGLNKISSPPDINFDYLMSFLLWPQAALRNSFNSLNTSGSKGIASYGVNKPIAGSLLSNLPSKEKEKIEFEFLVNSESIHVAHALDATYFPFFDENSKYTSHPYSMMMGNLLNYYKTVNANHLKESFDNIQRKEEGNPSIQLITIFDVNEYISITDFEKEISRPVVRKGLNSLFSELSALNADERKECISNYNEELAKALSGKKMIKHALDLGEDIADIGAWKKVAFWIYEYLLKKSHIAREISEYLEEKKLPSNEGKRRISLLTKINRVARLRKEYDN